MPFGITLMRSQATYQASQDQSQHQYEATGAGRNAAWLTFGIASDCTCQHSRERALGHVSDAMVQKQNSTEINHCSKKPVQKGNSTERKQCRKKRTNNKRHWRTLTEFFGHSVLLHEPEAQGAEGVALRGLHQSEGIEVPVVSCP